MINIEGAPCKVHKAPFCARRECLQHWHKVTPFTTNWLRLNSTTWAESEQYAIGLTTGNVSEVFVDKIAIWCYETLISEKLCAKLPELSKLITLLQNSLATTNRMQLQQKAHGMINSVLFTKYSDCKGIYLKSQSDDEPFVDGRFKCKYHRQIRDVPERTIIDMICRLISEASIHELMHGANFEDEDQTVTELAVYQVAMSMANTQDIARARV